MSWFRLDDQAYDHPKLARAGNEAVGAWARAGMWCAKHLTDGVVPREVALSIAPQRIWTILESVGLMDPHPEGLLVHDYLDWNPSRAEVMAERDRVRAQRSDAGRRSGEVRRTKNERPVERPVQRNTNEPLNETRTGSERKTNPDPDPDPDPVPINKKNSLTSQYRDQDPTLDRVRGARGGEPAQVRACLRLAAGAEGDPPVGTGEARDFFELDGGDET